MVRNDEDVLYLTAMHGFSTYEASFGQVLAQKLMLSVLMPEIWSLEERTRG